jgi:hypothetical protein
VSPQAPAGKVRLQLPFLNHLEQQEENQLQGEGSEQRSCELLRERLGLTERLESCAGTPRAHSRHRKRVEPTPEPGNDAVALLRFAPR